MPSGFVRLSPPAEKLLFQIHAAYTARLESGLSEEQMSVYGFKMVKL